ncbi:MAG: divergent polysaccharide deacetylase family protein, partial [Parvularculaceae bacterium]|nr:divergent polysaccharide deacetylase family protein [Parvularculaceae bacterium]
AGDNLQRLDWLLSRLPAAFGATNYLGSKFSSDPAMAAVLKRLDEAGLAYVDDTGSVSRAATARIVAPGGGARRDLDALVGAAAAGKRALGKTYLDEQTLEAIREWTRGLDEKNVALAPASAVVRAAGGEI